jgi:hypothetical protein
MAYSRRKKNLGKKGHSKKRRSYKRRSYSKKKYLGNSNNLGENSMKKADNAAVSGNIKSVKLGNYLKLQ